MASGYEKSPDYGGGPNPPVWFWLLVGLAVFAIPVGVILSAVLG